MLHPIDLIESPESKISLSLFGFDSEGLSTWLGLWTLACQLSPIYL